jgi:site-specific DNA-methyltransferase (adenine-specific)
MELNKIYNEDIFNIMKQIQDKSINLVYSEPDYNVNISYNGKKYQKNFNEYIEWYINLAKESLRILCNDGNAFFINYPKQNAHLRVKYLDDNFIVNEYIWVYNTNIGQSESKFTTAHRSILHVCKSLDNKWYKNQVAEPYKNPNDKRILKLKEKGSNGRMPYSWMYYDLVKNVNKNKTIHPCQMPDGLVKKLFNASTVEGDTILIHFGGSGGEILIAKELNRNWISAELVGEYVEMINYRLEHNGDIPSIYKINTKKTNNK